MNIATVVEGPTDRLALKAIIDHLYPGEHRYFDLQPIGSDTFGETGAGWKGVRNWCRQTWQRQDSSLSKVLSAMTGPPLDLLVIHVDADIATESDLQVGLPEPSPTVQSPCPPVLATIDNLRLVITHWLNFSQLADLPSQVLITIPAQDMENWTFAALYPSDPLCPYFVSEVEKKAHWDAISASFGPQHIPESLAQVIEQETIVLSGGSAYLPGLADWLSKSLNKPVIKTTVQPDHVVILGIKKLLAELPTYLRAMKKLR